MYTVKQISEITDISAYTIRFYDNEGLFPFLSRDKNNIRLFSERDLEWVKLVHSFRKTGMSLADIKKYIELCKQGKSTAEERYNIILKQKVKAKKEVIKMQERVKLLEKKENYYKIMMEEKGDFLNPISYTEPSQGNK